MSNGLQTNEFRFSREKMILIVPGPRFRHCNHSKWNRHWRSKPSWRRLIRENKTRHENYHMKGEDWSERIFGISQCCVWLTTGAVKSRPHPVSFRRHFSWSLKPETWRTLIRIRIFVWQVNHNNIGGARSSKQQDETTHAPHARLDCTENDDGFHAS